MCIRYLNIRHFHHFPLFVGVGHQDNIQNKPLSFTCRKLDTETADNICSLFPCVNWNFIDNPDLDVGCEKLIETINNCTDIAAPEKSVKILANKVIREPWHTKALQKSSHTLNKLFRKKTQNTPDHDSQSEYKRYRNLYNELKRKARKSYYCGMFNMFKNDVKNTWKTLRPLTDWKKICAKNLSLRMPLYISTNYRT